MRESIWATKPLDDWRFMSSGNFGACYECLFLPSGAEGGPVVQIAAHVHPRGNQDTLQVKHVRQRLRREHIPSALRHSDFSQATSQESHTRT